MPENDIKNHIPPVRHSILKKAVWHSVLLTTFTVLLLSVVAFIRMQELITGIAFEILPVDPVLGPLIFAKMVQSAQWLIILLTGVGFGAVLFAGLIAYVLAQYLTNPILKLSDRMQRLGPGHWGVHASLRTGDEIEQLEHVIVGMAWRLKGLYDHLEKEVEDRTRALRKQYALDRAILEGIQHGVVTVNREGRIIEANPASKTLLGLSRETNLIGGDARRILKFCERKKCLSGSAHPVTFCLKTRNAFDPDPMIHLSLIRKDGTALPVMFIGTPLMSGRTLLGGVFVFRDTTKEREMDYMKSEFVSLASHQLRTPLSTLRWYLELFGEEKKNLSADQQLYLLEMAHAAKRMTNLLTALLQTARIQGTKAEIKMTHVNIAPLIRDLCEDYKRFARDADLRFLCVLPKSVGLMTDVNLFLIVLQNLLNNAIKYTRPGGKVQLSIKRRVKELDVVVEDTGVGIPKQQQYRVFQKFFRAENVRQVDTDGSGLGLYISKNIIDVLGGKVTFTSEEGKGSTFAVKLPLKKKSRRSKK